MGGAKGLVGYMFSYAKGAKCLVMTLFLGPLRLISHAQASRGSKCL